MASPDLTNRIKQERQLSAFASLVDAISLTTGRFLPLKSGRNSLSSASGHSGSDDSLDRLRGGLSDKPEDDEEEEDEEGLMWDAQNALIIHQPHLALEIYTKASLPPHKSPRACLASGNLIARGSSLSQHPVDLTSGPLAGRRRSSDSPSLSTSLGRGNLSTSLTKDSGSLSTSPPIHRTASRFFASLFASTSSAPAEPIPETPPVPQQFKPLPSPVNGDGWALPRDPSDPTGRRAKRDAEGMGRAGAWFVLGLGWVVDNEMEHGRRSRESSSRTPVVSHGKDDRIQIQDDEEIMGTMDEHTPPQDGVDTEILHFKPKIKHGRSTKPTQSSPNQPISLSLSPRSPQTKQDHADDLDTPLLTNSGNGSRSGETDSTEINTPGVADLDDDAAGLEGKKALEDELTILNLVCDLLRPLLLLYRNGHIQLPDPVSLPPIKNDQLPKCLRPIGDLKKGRNAWQLGGVVVGCLMGLELMHVESEGAGLVGEDENTWSGEEGEAVGRSVTRKARKAREIIEKLKKDVEQSRRGAAIMGHYILAITSSPSDAATHFSAIIEIGSCGLEAPDSLLEPAAKRLEIIQRAKTPLHETPATPLSPPDGLRFTAKSKRKGKGRQKDAGLKGGVDDGYPFPSMGRNGRRSVSSPVESSQRQAATSSKRQGTLSPEAARYNTTRGHKKTMSRSSTVSKSPSIYSLTESTISRSQSKTGLMKTLVMSSTTSLASLGRDWDQLASLEDRRPGLHSGLEDDITPKGSLNKTPSALAELRLISKKSSQALAEMNRSSSEREDKQLGAWWPSLGTWSMRTTRPSTPKPSTPIQNESLPPSSIVPPTPRQNRPADIPISPSKNVPNSLQPATPTIIPATFTPPIRTIASSPHLNTFHQPPSSKTLHKSSTSLSAHNNHPEIAGIDPTLAAAEMRSSLTKQMVCGVCSAEGINFPQCRKCGMVFCSRDCRVGEQGAGDGKKHVCGIWTARKLLTVPGVRPLTLGTSSVLRAGTALA